MMRSCRVSSGWCPIMAGTMLSSDADVKGQPTSKRPAAATTPAGLLRKMASLTASSPAAWASLSTAFWVDLAHAAGQRKCLGAWAGTTLGPYIFPEKCKSNLPCWAGPSETSAPTASGVSSSSLAARSFRTAPTYLHRLNKFDATWGVGRWPLGSPCGWRSGTCSTSTAKAATTRRSSAPLTWRLSNGIAARW